MTPDPVHPAPAPVLSASTPTSAEYDSVLLAELQVDRGAGDITSHLAVPEDARAVARLVARAEGRLAGIDGFARAFNLADGGAQVSLAVADGDRVFPDQVLATVTGSARALLWAERTALNLLQHLSGIATLTDAHVRAAASTSDAVRIMDTRKTLPGLRRLQKHAVRCGGGVNHRMGLDDEVLFKENHLDLAGQPPGDLLRRARADLGGRVRLVAEARTEDEALAAAEGGADVVLLDNMAPDLMARLVPALRSASGCREDSAFPFEVEASGGISLETIASVAATGVDRISVGALTHSVPALDLSLYMEPLE